ncbi:MAG: UDP-N-acetylmuramoyl-L-alanyl-D-glutamate--2,6-diaminopimelate ligase [Acidobacteria bacterium]|nr:UDP-N-acetylmuramoyl-L-alanyl-D-glutamate--2,6-diaminopimelate ligase [Acidobacteriota bacterium]
MRLNKLLSGLAVRERTHKESDPEVSSIEYDSRRVRPGSLFFAVPGLVTDGYLYIPQALENGAVVIVSSRPAPPDCPVPWVHVGAMRTAMALLANQFFGNPSERLRLAGITGTNGKTTTAFLIHSILQQVQPCIMIGTIKTVVGGEEAPSVRTTPEAIDIQKLLRSALEKGCRWGAMEVSSHALSLQRVYGCHFPVAVFTNLSQDHLDFHQTIDDYFQAKNLLFRREYNPGIRDAVVNGDDLFIRKLQVSDNVRFTRYGFSKDYPVYPRKFQTSVEGTVLELNFFNRILEVRSPLCGEHNIYNIMAAACAASLLGASDEAIARGLEQAQQVPGRFERVPLDRTFNVIVDYAHTPDALENTLKVCGRLKKGRLICVFGCGGDRDRTKRPRMGEAAARLSDYVIITSDNPRSEPPEGIIEEICSGIPKDFKKFEKLVNRREAIAKALRLAREGDIVLIAGKGHEDYQEIGATRLHFDDCEVVKELS